ncbi:MAG: 7-carboxy-7-deazaguanine synthase QueE [Candidatus Omnitrophota bacterium]
MKTANITEIFFSYQGEGPYTGARQVFVRFHGCSFGCRYCDTRLDKYDVITAGDLIDKVCDAARDYHSVSVTGGEPLEQTEFLEVFLPELKRRTGKPVYLETNGVLPDELAKVINHVDIVAMDIKLPSSTKKKPVWAEHKRFLETARAKEVFVKSVVTRDTTFDDVLKACDLIAAVDSKTRFILQPVDPVDGVQGPSDKWISKLRMSAARKLPNTGVMRQRHKEMGIR